MNKILLLMISLLFVACNKNAKEEQLLTDKVWISSGSNFAAVKFTENGVGYDLINIADTLKYKFEDGKFLMIDQKGDQTRTITFDIKKLDQDSFIIETNQKDALRLKFRKAKLEEILYGSWKSKDFSYKFLSYADSGSGFKHLNNDSIGREFFSYYVTKNNLKLKSANSEENYNFDFDKSFHILKLINNSKTIEFTRNKFHEN